MEKGFISLYRKIYENWLWDDKPFAKGQAWIDLLLNAKYKDEKFVFKDEVVEGKRGTVYKSITFLADRWGWGRDKTRSFLKQLQSDGMIEYSTSTHSTTITIINYNQYQFSTTTSQQQNNSESPARPQRSNTYNNIKKPNNPNNISTRFRFSDTENEVEPSDWFDNLKED